MIQSIHWNDSDFIIWSRGYINRVTTFEPVFKEIYPLLLRELGQNFIRGGTGSTHAFHPPWQQLTRLTRMNKPQRAGILRVTGKMMRSVSSGSALKRSFTRISMTVRPRDTKAGMLIKTHHKGATWMRPAIHAKKKKALHWLSISGQNRFSRSAPAIRITRPARPIMVLSSQFLKYAKRFVTAWVVGRVRAGDSSIISGLTGPELGGMPTGGSITGGEM